MAASIGCDKTMATNEWKRLLNGQGQLTALPRKPESRQAALKWLTGHFVPGRFYSEKEVNERLSGCSTSGDYALLRRDLCDGGLLSRTRSGSRYWRSDFPGPAGDCGPVRLRGMEPSDAACLLAIHATLRDYDALSGHAFTPADAQAVVDRTDLPPDGSSEFFLPSLIVDAASGMAAGYLACYAGYPAAGMLWIGSLFIRQDQQGRGIGSAVMRFVTERAATSGFTRLGLGVYAQNTPGLRFWIGQGFRSIRDIKEQDGRAILSLSRELETNQP